jgi:hypothetical protein
MATKKSSAGNVTGTAVAVKGATNVVAIQDRLRSNVAKLQDRIAPAGGDKIALTQAKKFKLPDGRTSDGPLDLVIVDFVTVHNYYEGAYDKDNIVPPNCFAIGINPLQMVPSVNAPERQADNCQTCPMNQFGSSGKGKACKNGRLLAVLPPDADEDTPMMVLSVPPTSIKAFDGYVAAVASKFGMSPAGVVTTISMDDGVDWAQLKFGNPVINDNLEGTASDARLDYAEKRLKQEPDVSGFEAAEAKPAKKVASSRRK